MRFATGPSTASATLLASFLFAAPATAQDAPIPAPPQVTCADWGAYRGAAAARTGAPTEVRRLREEEAKKMSTPPYNG